MCLAPEQITFLDTLWHDWDTVTIAAEKAAKEEEE
jgi:hypothetical protein